MDLAGPPAEPVVVPKGVRPLVGSDVARAAWRNGLGGLTFVVGERSSRVFVKWSPWTAPDRLTGEVARLRWVGPRIKVPEVLDVGADDEGEWFVSRDLGGENAVSPRWRREPARAARAMGEGLRRLHDELDCATCPFDWSLATRRRAVARRQRTEDLDAVTLEWELSEVTVADALETLREPPAEDLVVCHGDACAPNTLLSETGEFLGLVDLGRLGRGDRWADLAIASWSTVWNYGPGYEGDLYDGYGAEPDEEKIRYYRILWSLE